MNMSTEATSNISIWSQLDSALLLSLTIVAIVYRILNLTNFVAVPQCRITEKMDCFRILLKSYRKIDDAGMFCKLNTKLD